MNNELKEYIEVNNVRVFFKLIKKEMPNGKVIEYVDTLLVFPDNHDFLLNPMSRYKNSCKAMYRECVKSVL